MGSTIELRHIPGPPLSQFVDLFWYVQAGPAPHSKERLLPTGTIELVIPLEEERSRFYDAENLNRFREHSGALLLGAQAGCVVIDSTRGAAVIGVHFRPGGAFPFLGVPASAVEDQTFSLEDLWGKHAGALRERVLSAHGPRAKLQVLESILLSRIGVPEKVPAIAFAVCELSRGRRVTEVVDQIGISPRRFIRLFHDHVGLTPKVFSRVRRFQDAITGIGAGLNIAWANLAADCGYFDQAHFNHDFRTFSGLNPERYLVERTDRENHVAL